MDYHYTNDVPHHRRYQSMILLKESFEFILLLNFILLGHRCRKLYLSALLFRGDACTEGSETSRLAEGYTSGISGY